MTVIYILFGLFAVFLFFDFKKTVLLYAPWKLFFNFNVRFGPITFDLAMSILIIIVFWFKRKSLEKTDFLFKKAFVVYGILYVLTCLFPHPVVTYIPRIIIMVLAYAYVYYYCMQSRADVKFAIFSYAIFACVMCANGLLTPLYNINPLDEFLQSVSDKDNSIFIDNEWLRMGNVRYRSFIPHAISYGVACVIILYLLVWYYISEKNLYEKMYNAFLGVSVVFLFSGIIICGSRTPIIGLFPFVYLFFRSRFLPAQSRRLLLFGTIAVLLVSGDYIVYSIQSLFDSKLAHDAGGSSTDLRVEQYAIAWNWMKEDFIFGKGMDFDAYSANSAILGAESVWLPLMYNNGIVGVLSYALFYYYMFKVIPEGGICRIYLVMITLGWMLMRTATSLIGVTDAQYLTVMICVLKYYQLDDENYFVNNNSGLQGSRVHS